MNAKHFQTNERETIFQEQTWHSKNVPSSQKENDPKQQLRSIQRNKDQQKWQKRR